MTAPKVLRRKEASAYLQATWRIPASVGQLAKLASQGVGPARHDLGRGVASLYPIDELDAYARARLGELRHTRLEAIA